MSSTIPVYLVIHQIDNKRFKQRLRVACLKINPVLILFEITQQLIPVRRVCLRQLKRNGLDERLRFQRFLFIVFDKIRGRDGTAISITKLRCISALSEPGTFFEPQNALRVQTNGMTALKNYFFKHLEKRLASTEFMDSFAFPILRFFIINSLYITIQIPQPAVHVPWGEEFFKLSHFNAVQLKVFIFQLSCKSFQLFVKPGFVNVLRRGAMRTPILEFCKQLRV